MLSEPKSGEKIPKGWFGELYRHLFRGSLIKGDGQTTQVTCNNGVYQIHAKAAARTSVAGKSEYNGMFKVVNASDETTQKVKVVDGANPESPYCGMVSFPSYYDYIASETRTGFFLGGGQEYVLSDLDAALESETRYLYYVGLSAVTGDYVDNFKIFNDAWEINQSNPNVRTSGRCFLQPFGQPKAVIAKIYCARGKIIKIEQIQYGAIEASKANTNWQDYIGENALIPSVNNHITISRGVKVAASSITLRNGELVGVGIGSGMYYCDYSPTISINDMIIGKNTIFLNRKIGESVLNGDAFIGEEYDMVVNGWCSASSIILGYVTVAEYDGQKYFVNIKQSHYGDITIAYTILYNI